MKTRLHFGILVILLAFLGTYLEQRTLPNQQIVIQFSDKDIAEEDAESAIEIVKKRLQSIGVEHIKIAHYNNGQLKITYYSDSDVERIQNILSKEEGFKFPYESENKRSPNFPKNKSIKDYELNISEIQNSSNINWDFERTSVVELNQKSDHSFNPKVTSSGEHINHDPSNSEINFALKVNTSVAKAMDRISYEIPEVRAGPPSNGII